MENEEKKIVEDIIKKNRLPYSIELIEVNGDKYTIRNNFGNKIVYIKKGDDYLLVDEE